MKKVKVNIPLVAYDSYTTTIEAPDDFNTETGKSESQPDFSIIDAIYSVDCDLSSGWEIDDQLLTDLKQSDTLAEVIDE